MNEKPALERLFSPRSIAVVGASADLDKLTGRTVKALLDFGYEGRVYPVNPKYDAVGGLPALKDAAEIPEGTDVAVLSIPARLIPETLEKCGRRKIPFAVVYSSGFAETGDTSLQEEIVSVARRERIRVLGPNCQGFANFAENIPVTFSGALYNAPSRRRGTSPSSRKAAPSVFCPSGWGWTTAFDTGTSSPRATNATSTRWSAPGI